MPPQLYKYQAEGIQWLSKRSRAMLCDDMGLGKTLQATVAAYIRRYTILVICPKILMPIWAATIDDVCTKDWPRKITWYDYVSRKPNEFQRYNFDLVILDEAHLLKDSGTKRYKAILKAIGHIPNRWLLTGTPVVNYPADLLAQLNVLNVTDHLFGPSGAAHFKFRYCFDKWTGTYRGANNLPELAEKLAPVMLRRSKFAVLDQLPPIQYISIPLDGGIDPEYIKNFDTRRPNENDRHYAERLQAGVKEEKAMVSIEWLESWLANNPDPESKMIVYCYHISVQQKLIDHFANICRSLVSADSIEDRQQNIKIFEKVSAYKLLICSYQLAGVGLTILAARWIAWVELPFTMMIYNQANARPHRIGQTEQVTVCNLILEHSQDERCVEILTSKLKITNDFHGENDISAELFKLPDREKQLELNI